MEKMKAILSALDGALAARAEGASMPSVAMSAPRACVPTGKMQISRKRFGKNDVIIAASPIYRRVWPDRSKYVPHYGKKQAEKDAKRAPAPQI